MSDCGSWCGAGAGFPRRWRSACPRPEGADRSRGGHRHHDGGRQAGLWQMVYLGLSFATEQDAELNNMLTPDPLLEPGAELSVFKPLLGR